MLIAITHALSQLFLNCTQKPDFPLPPLLPSPFSLCPPTQQTEEFESGWQRRLLRVPEAVVAPLVRICLRWQQCAGHLRLFQLRFPAVLAHALGALELRADWRVWELRGDTVEQALVPHADGLLTPDEPALAGDVRRLDHARADRPGCPFDRLGLHAVLLSVDWKEKCTNS